MHSSSSIPRPINGFTRRYKTPTVIQMEAAECGAAALTIILGYYGRVIPLEDVRLMCSVSRDGSNALKIIQAAEYYGLKAEGFSTELSDLYDAPLPLIAFWNFDHFVVIEGFGKHRVFINDPESGPRTVSYEELDELFTGVILTFSPEENFLSHGKEKEKKGLLLIWNRFKLFKEPLAFTLLVGFFTVFPVLALTVFSQVFIDNVLIGKMHAWSVGVLTGFALITLLITGMHFLQQWILIRFSFKLSTLLSTQFVWHTLRLPILFFMQRYGGEIASRLALNEAVARSWISGILPIVINIITASLFAMIMLFYDVSITLIGIGIVSFNLFLMHVLYRSREDAYANYRHIQGRLTSFTINGLEAIDSLKATGGEYHFINQYGGIYAASLNTQQTMAYNDLLLGTLSPFLSTFGSLTVLMLGSLRIIQGQMTVGEFVALQMLFNYFTTPALSLVNLNQTLQLLRINLLRIDDVMCHSEDDLLNTQGKDFEKWGSIDRLSGQIEVKNLSFGYGPLDPPILKNINFKIAPGTTVAIVGPSGCGKSTLVKLIGGLLHPKNGEILFDNFSRFILPRALLTRSIGVIEQSSYLFEDSIAQNISLMDQMFNQEDMIQAAQDACIHEDIMARQGGYQLMLERNGANLSGGQRQRLEIACVLSRHPSIIVLDEATSAIDSLTERKILENIRRRRGTCLMITHRLKTIVDCDVIFVMDNGEIVQAGSHEQLIGQPGLYQTLVGNQSPSC